MRTGGGVVSAAIGQRGVGVGHAVVVIGRFSSCAFFLCSQQGDVAVDHKLRCALLGFRHVLRDLPHTPLRGDEVFAAVFVQRAVQERKQG